MRLIAASLAGGLVALLGLGVALVGPGRGPSPDVTLTRAGCDGGAYDLPASHAPELLVSNRADAAMVFSLPDLSAYVTVPPGQRGTLPLQPGLTGSYRFFCLAEADHELLLGNRQAQAFFCGLDAYDFAREAVRQRMVYSEGTLVLQRHAPV